VRILPDWMKESLNRRFIDLSYEAERQDNVVPIKSRAMDIFEYLRNNEDDARLNSRHRLN
jgi:hypothetical protein